MKNYRKDKVYFNKERLFNDMKIMLFFILLIISSLVFSVLFYIAVLHIWALIAAYSLLLLFAIGLFIKQRYFSR